MGNSWSFVGNLWCDNSNILKINTVFLTIKLLSKH